MAEIADVANVSVKTLFVYFRSKEDLAFADSQLIDAILAALRQRPPGTSDAEAVAGALLAEARDQGDPRSGLEGFHRGYGDSPALQSGLLRMWAGYEDQLTAFLAAEAGRAATPQVRLHAAQLVAIARTVTSPETRALLAGLSPAQALAAPGDWLENAARSIRPAD